MSVYLSLLARLGRIEAINRGNVWHTAQQAIQTQLVKIEAEENVTIFYACENNRRTWDFSCAHNDYNIRILGSAFR